MAISGSPEPLSVFRMELEHLRDNGYQPMYNGRPSCPFCANFLDDEETHTESCPLVGFLAASERPPVDPLREALTVERNRAHEAGEHEYERGVEWAYGVVMRAALVSPAAPRAEGLTAKRIQAEIDRHGGHTPGRLCIECGDDRPWKTVMREILARLSDTGERP